MRQKVIGRGIKSNFIEQESGRRFYVSRLSYQDQMQKLSQKYVQEVKLVKQSEFKKPYLEKSYPEMEHFEWPGRYDPEFPSVPGPGFQPDCSVGWEAAGAMQGWRICAPDDDCAAWIFTCAHKIVSFSCGNCNIVLIKQLEGDRIFVVICSKEDVLSVHYITNDGKDHKAPFLRYCGVDCTKYKDPPVIGYTTQQMFLNGTQALTASGGAGGPYSWSIIAGGGSLSGNVGNSVTYSAASTNAECANNPTIQLKDICNNTKTLKLAVTAAPGTSIAVGYSVTTSSGGCTVAISRGILGCDSVDYSATYCAGGYGPCCTCDLTGYPACAWTLGGPCNGYTCPSAGGGCWTGSSPCVASCVCSARTWSSVPGNYDIRTAAEKTAACCPAALL